jgi:ABC-type polar amino acid transport system ATPase subunit
MIIIDKVFKSFGNLRVLNNINLKINKGEIIAITGPSGSGKSTLLRCINNLETPSSGTIKIDNIDSRDKTIFKKIGMVFQHFQLFPHMKVIENLIYAPIKILGENKQQAIERANLLLGQMSLSDKADNYPNNLSGGQKQRVAIARTLMMQPEIILFDEPTSALDPEMVKEVLNVIKSLAQTGITILIVTHEMSFAKNIASRILFFDQGNIIEDCSPEQFFTNPTHPRTKIFLENITN